MGPSLLLLTLTWCVLTRDAAVANVGLGALLSWIALRFVNAPPTPWRRNLARLPAALALLGYFVWEMLVSNLRMALLVLSPRRVLRPALIEVPVEVESDTELAVLSNLVTLTPGTLGIDACRERGTLLIHVMTDDDPATLAAGLHEGLVRRVRRVFSC